MSCDLSVFLKHSALPTSKEWVRAIQAQGFDFVFKHEFELFSHTGFLPCQFRGALAGFEFSCCPLGPGEKRDYDIPDQFDTHTSFITGANMREFATSLIAAGVLCQMSGGTLFDPQAGEWYAPGSVLEMVREQLAAIENEI